MASPKKTKRRVKSPINYRLTPSNKQSFEPDKFELRREVKSENKSSDNHQVTTSQLATTLAGIWSYIGQPAVLKSDENLNFEICQKEAVQCKNQVSTYEDLKAMKKKLLFSYYKMARIDGLWHNGNYRDCHYRRAIYDPKYLRSTRSLCNARHKFYTVETTEDPLFGTDGNDTEPIQEAGSQKEEEIMLVLDNKAYDQESENKIESLIPSSCENSQKELLESSSTVSEFTVDKFIEKGYEGRSDSLQENFTRCQFFVQDRVKGVVYANRHALAGALAGTMVSLCLHPVDTVKTIIQSRGMGGYSFYRVLRQTLTERGLMGLYRGIASNIASSAPISAIYTLTYESVKGNLIPIFPKEYQSVTHCIAGGCSSVATSFVFTPSERIKQQMQIGTQYKNCWNALVGCIEKGGVATLYAGWRAVLCRNIPHSIIKFYTYERLKRFLLEGKTYSTLNPCQTLICGGMAGATAALFTTPFDVVKTRIQTQAPGTVRKYDGVIQALNKIMKNEGLPGLYRGLIPRLGMYVSQGSIFFASYEFLKALLDLDVKRHSSKSESKRDENPPLRNS